jgi:hypothetical protein
VSSWANLSPQVRPLSLLVLGLVLVLSVWIGSNALMANTPERASPDPPPRDGNIAIEQELDTARRSGSAAAFDLFIARHPSHPLTEVAKRERDRLPGRSSP